MRERVREREREREREGERARASERERERERDRILRCIWTANRWRRGKNQAKKIYPYNFPVCWLRPHHSRFFTGISRKRYVVLHRLCLKWEREGERERETERVPCRIILFTMRWELHYICVYPTIFSCVDPRPQLSRFFTGISRRRYVAYVYNGKLISLIGHQRVGIFPPKSKIPFYLSLALIWCRNFQELIIPLGGDT